MLLLYKCILYFKTIVGFFSEKNNKLHFLGFSNIFIIFMIFIILEILKTKGEEPARCGLMRNKDQSNQEKHKISVALDQSTFEWLQKNVRNRSAFIRELIQDYSTQQKIDPKLQGVADTLMKLKGLELTLVPGLVYRSLIDIGLKHDPGTVTDLFRESGRFLGIYISSSLPAQNWIDTFRQILMDLFLDMHQISVTLEAESILSLRFVSTMYSDQVLFLIGNLLEEALNRLGFKISEQSVVTGLLSQTYKHHI